MKIEGIIQVGGKPSVEPLFPIYKAEKRKEESQEAQQYSYNDSKVSDGLMPNKDEAIKVAEKLNKQFTPEHKVRFVIRDVTKNSSDNIVIQIIDDKGHIVSEIPSEKVKKMAEEITSNLFGDKNKELLKGMIIDFARE